MNIGLQTRRVWRESRQAREDVVEIYTYLFSRNEKAAERVLKSFELTFIALLQTPRIGQLWDSPDPRLEGVRVVPANDFRNYLIFFRPTAKGVDVLRVVHGARDLGPLVDAIDHDFTD